jgi:D-sedoheptulose 7-phosphate isomerase
MAKPLEPSLIEEIQQQIDASIAAKRSIPVSELVEAIDAVVDAYRSGNKVLLAGNGGSAADAQHIAAELVGRYLRERKPLPAIALSVNTSSLTAIGNDYGYAMVFVRQLEAFARPGDVFIAISTSGQSENVIRAMNKAREMGVKTIGFTGRDGGKMKDLSDIHLCVPSSETPRIQECHILMGHILCDVTEQRLLNS